MLEPRLIVAVVEVVVVRGCMQRVVVDGDYYRILSRARYGHQLLLVPLPLEGCRFGPITACRLSAARADGFIFYCCM